MDYEIITIGSATLDVFVKVKAEVRKHQEHTDLCYHLGEKLLIEDMHTTTGGGGTNTAVAFARLGLRTGWIGAVGTDLQCNAILEDLRAEGVEFLGTIKEGKTGYSVILLDKKDRTVLAFKGVNNSLNMKDVKSPIKSKWVYCSSMMGESRKTQEEIVRNAKESGSKIAANISLYEAKLGIKNLKEFLSLLDILVLNKEEAMALTKEKNAISSAHKIRKAGPKIVVVTDGENPIYVYDGEKEYIREVKKVKPLNTTGAGDAFAAGFVYGIIKEEDIEKAIDYGMKESRSVVLGMGAKQGLLRRF